MSKFQKFLIALLIPILCSEFLIPGIFAEEFYHSPEELPSYYIAPETLSADISETKNEVSIMSLLREQTEYKIRTVEVEKNESEIDAPDIEVERYTITNSTHIRKKIKGFEKNPMRTTLRDGTVVREKNAGIINPSTITLSEVTPIIREKAIKKIGEKSKARKKGGKIDTSSIDPIVFEFGIPGKHLIFSTPVEVSIDTPTLMDGITMDLFVLHEGDTDFNTSGLTLDPNSGCNMDGTAQKPGSTGVVKNGKVTFYTCGASSFTMNPSGGTTGSNDLRLIIGDCAQTQLYYNGLTQIYTGNPPATGCSAGSTMDSWPVLRIGGTSYGNDFTAWSTNTTTGTTAGNTYSATSTMTRVVGGLTYTLIIDWSYTAPNKYFTWSWRVTIPATNTNNVRFYYGMDSAVAGGDTNDVGYLTSTGGLTFGVYDSTANVLSAFRYMSGQTWTAYESGPYNTVRGKIAAGTNFANTITPNADLGYGVNWDFGTTPGTYSGTLQWTLAPYVSGNVPDLIPGIGLPEGPLTTNLTSEMPITVTNAGNLASSGVHSVILTIPTNITGPASAFVNNGWSCGAQVGTGVTCTKTTTISGSLGEDTVRIPVTPTLAASGSNVRFDVRITNPGDSNVTNNTAFAINAVVGGAPAGDPGGVAGENLWLRSNTGTNCTVTGCTITSWNNQGGLAPAANAVTGVGTVTYDTINRINGYPTIYFNGAALNTNNTLGLPTRANSIFAVTRIATGGQFLMGTQTATNNARSWTTRPTTDTWMRNNSTVFYNGGNTRSASIPAITSTIRQTAGASAGYTNGRSLLTSTNTNTFTVNNFGIGRVGNTTSTLSNVAEVIIYPTAITLAQKNQVESYLGIKYGITLDQTTATNYVFSNGSIVWSATGAGVYNKNITGIGRDDTSTLNHLNSQSITNTGDLSVAKSFITNNRYALIWGNDAGIVTSFTGSDAPFGYNRIPREWQFQEKNGDVGVVTLSYPQNSVPSGYTGTLLLMTDSDGNFATGSTFYTGTLNGSRWDFSLNITDMQYITFARTIPTDTTPPIITAENVASGSITPSGNFPYSFSYADTGSSINTGSVSLRIFSWNTGTLNWNATNLAPTYAITGSISSSTGNYTINNLPFGKYRFDRVVSDTLGNTLTSSSTLFVDGIEWIVSSPIYAIGGQQTDITGFGSGELLITVRTVGAGFDLTMVRTEDLTLGTGTISVWDTVNGWGYELYNGVGYSGTLSAHGTNQTLAIVPKTINQNGEKNTYVYRVKYGMRAGIDKNAGDYIGKLRFGINLTY